MSTTTKKLKYTEKLGEQFIEWNAAQSIKGANGKVKFDEWREEISKIRFCLIASRTSRKQYALKEYPNRWEEFLKMKQEKLEKQTKLD